MQIFSQWGAFGWSVFNVHSCPLHSVALFFLYCRWTLLLINDDNCQQFVKAILYSTRCQIYGDTRLFQQLTKVLIINLSDSTYGKSDQFLKIEDKDQVLFNINQQQSIHSLVHTLSIKKSLTGQWKSMHGHHGHSAATEIPCPIWGFPWFAATKKT